MKITVEKASVDEGKRHFKLITADYSALETRVAARDCFFNPEGGDANLNELFDPNSALNGDMHSFTGHSTFIKQMKRKKTTIHDSNTGKDWVAIDKTHFNVKRNGAIVNGVNAKDLLESDEIIDFNDEKNFPYR